ncbi:hypothetical protein Daudx_1699 [Candidatus Desulforudis audaxviator]|nr:hypothetical protein Daudx_1699 [Candidatus Desulforudis audaxviator]
MLAYGFLVNGIKIPGRRAFLPEIYILGYHYEKSRSQKQEFSRRVSN